MSAKQKTHTRESEKSIRRIERGFVPDFSCYLEKYYPLDDAYREPALIEKLGNMLKILLTEKNPSSGLPQNGYCKKLEKMNPSQDAGFFNRCKNIAAFPTLHLYYASFGNNGQGIAIGFNFVTRRAYFLAIDRKHTIRPYHGKLG